jgi:hypothetical protein
MKSHYKTARDLIDGVDVAPNDLSSNIAMAQVYATLAVADAIAELGLVMDGGR